jgi:hypothetical protein
MNATVIILAILCIWPADTTKEPKVIAAEAPSLEVCEANIAAMKVKIEADPAVRFVSGACLELNRGNKA